MRQLSVKALKFAALVYAGKPKTQAYRESFDCRDGRPDNRVYDDARRLAKDPRVIAELARLKVEDGAPHPALAGHKTKTEKVAEAAPAAAVKDSAVVLPFPITTDSPAVVPVQPPKPPEPAAEDRITVPLDQPLAGFPELDGKARHTEEWFVALLEVNAARALQLVPVRDSKGNPTGEYVYAGGVANKAIELMARIKGVLVDRKQITVTQLHELPLEEVRRRRAEVSRQLAMERGEDVEDVEFKELT